MADFSIHIDSAAVDAALASVQRNVGNLQPAWDMIGQDLWASVMDNFSSEGRPTKWAPLAASTLARKARKGQAGKKILNATGTLNQEIGWKPDSRGVDVGTMVKYAAYHQDGTRRIPARPFLVLQDADEEKAANTLLEYALRGF